MAALTKSGGSKRNGGAKSRSAGAKEPSASAEGGSRQDVTRQDASRQEVADHIASMLESMRRLVHQKDMSLLYFLIGAAVEEANAEKASRA